MRKPKDSALFLLAFLAGCGRCGKTPDTSSSPDAAVVVISSAPAPEAGPPLVDLLWTTSSVVAVSSRVDNPRDIPEHLVDKNEGTAWNGKTGDLVGAWIAFRVPADSTVSHVMLSTGFDKTVFLPGGDAAPAPGALPLDPKTSAKEDLFTANYRVAKVRVLREGKALKEATLDTNQRLPQKIDIGTPGGEFKIEVLEVIPGTHAGWKEITISELGVFGAPGHAKPKPSPPMVLVGTLLVDSSAPYDDTVGATYEAACKAFIKDDHEAADESAKTLGADAGPPAATCDPPRTVSTATHGIVLETAHVAIDDEPKPFSFEHFEGEVLAMRTAAGVKLTNVRVSGHLTEFYSSYDFKLIAEKWIGDQLVLDVERKCGCGSDGYFPPGESPNWDETVIVHTVCDGTTATCVTTDQRKK